MPKVDGSLLGGRKMTTICSKSRTVVTVSRKCGKKCYELYTYVLNFCEIFLFEEEWTFNNNSHRGLGWTEKKKDRPLYSAIQPSSTLKDQRVAVIC